MKTEASRKLWLEEIGSRGHYECTFLFLPVCSGTLLTILSLEIYLNIQYDSFQFPKKHLFFSSHDRCKYIFLAF